MRKLTRLLQPLSLAVVAILGSAAGPATGQPINDDIDREVKAVEAKMVAWRRDIHQNPELGNHEFRTSHLVAEHLKKLGHEVREHVAHTRHDGIDGQGQWLAQVLRGWMAYYAVPMSGSALSAFRHHLYRMSSTT